MARDGIHTNDRQLACARIGSQEAQDYLAAMACAANYAWVNRSSMTFLTRQAFAKVRRELFSVLSVPLVCVIVPPSQPIRVCGLSCPSNLSYHDGHRPTYLTVPYMCG